MIQGVGGAIASPTALSLITTEFDEGKERNRAFAVYAAVSGAGAALGLLLGGILTNYLSWRWVLFVNVPIGIVLMVGAVPATCTSPSGSRAFDFLGALLSVAGMVATRLRLHPRRAHGWSNSVDLRGVHRLGAAAASASCWYEAQVAEQPMMPMRIFEDRNRSGAYLVMLVVGAAHVRDVLLRDVLRAGRARVQRAQGRLRVPAGRVRHRHRLAGRASRLLPEVRTEAAD